MNYIFFVNVFKKTFSIIKWVFELSAFREILNQVLLLL